MFRDPLPRSLPGAVAEGTFPPPRRFGRGSISRFAMLNASLRISASSDGAVAVSGASVAANGAEDVVARQQTLSQAKPVGRRESVIWAVHPGKTMRAPRATILALFTLALWARTTRCVVPVLLGARKSRQVMMAKMVVLGAREPPFEAPTEVAVVRTQERSPVSPSDQMGARYCRPCPYFQLGACA